MTASSTPEASCPRCSALATGPFCAQCGAAIDPRSCASCRGDLADDANFCHLCGAPAASGVARAALPRGGEPSGLAATAPWIVAGIALVALIGLVAVQRLGTARAASAAPPTSASAPLGAGAGDISQLPPRELASRLYDRIMRLNAENKPDSVQFFASMAVPTFEMLDTMDADARYDLGRIAEVAGALPVAAAQADTLLREQPTHLLGLILAARVARAEGDQTRRRELEQRLLASHEREMQSNLPEYRAHESDITNAVAEARRRE